MRSSNRLRGRGREKEPCCALACNRMQSHRSRPPIVCLPFSRIREEDARLFFARVYTYTLACRAELNCPARGQWGGREINGNYVCTFAFEESNPFAGYHRRRSSRSFSEKKKPSVCSHRPLACALITYLTLPSRKTKVCTSNTGSRITRTLGITVHNADNIRGI